ncbi:prepilin peptidase [Candidatus Pacearchaeota archaeon]|nr:prepilin peptidase [Candidatus Pacearchaeota archaeon]
MEEFLFFIGFVGMLLASVQDIKEREIDNILNFSLLALGLSWGAFNAVFSHNYLILLYAVLGFFIFLAIGNLFYYSRVFAGGDAKLLIALGPFIFIGSNIIQNLEYAFYFILLFLIVGSLYGLVYSMIVSIRNFNEFSKHFKQEISRKKFLLFISFIFFIIFLAISFYVNQIFLFIAFLFLVSPFLFLYARSVEKGSMIKEIDYESVREGDWLYKTIKIRGKIINPSWSGLSKKDVALIKKARKNVVIRDGIPFVPAIFGAYILFAAYFFGLLDFGFAFFG